MFTQRALVLLGLLAAAGVSAQSTCPAGISLSFKSNPAMATRDKNIKASYALVNKASVSISSGSVAITLPADASYTRSGSRPGVSQQGSAAGGVVTWAAAGSLAKGKARTFWVDSTVDSDATALLFSARAALTLSDGTTCTITTASSVQVKGFKNAVAAPANSGTTENYLSCLDAGTAGYAEEVLYNYAGVEVVHACYDKSAQPAKLTTAIGIPSYDLTSAIFIRADGTKTADYYNTIFGYCYNYYDGNNEELGSNMSPPGTLNNYWCVADYDGEDTPPATGSSDYFGGHAVVSDGSFLIQTNGYYSGLSALNPVAGQTKTCCRGGSVFIKY